MKVLAGIDDGPQRGPVLELARVLAHGDPLDVVHVHWRSPTTAVLGPRFEDVVVEQGRAVLDAVRGSLPSGAVTHLCGARTAEAGLHHLATLQFAEALVVGSSRHGALHRVVAGSVAQRVLDGAPCAVALAPAGWTAPPGDRLRRIGVAFDGDDDGVDAARGAAALARRHGASLEVLTVVEPLPAAAYPGVLAAVTPEVVADLDRAAQARLDACLEELDVPVTARLLHGPPAPTLAEAATGLDLLVCGPRHHGPLGVLLLGSVTRALVAHAPCPLLVLPRPGAARARPLRRPAAALAC